MIAALIQPYAAEAQWPLKYSATLEVKTTWSCIERHLHTFPDRRTESTVLARHGACFLPATGSSRINAMVNQAPVTSTCNVCVKSCMVAQRGLVRRSGSEREWL